MNKCFYKPLIISSQGKEQKLLTSRFKCQVHIYVKGDCLLFVDCCHCLGKTIIQSKKYQLLIKLFFLFIYVNYMNNNEQQAYNLLLWEGAKKLCIGMP